MTYYHLVAPTVVVRANETAFTYASTTPLAVGMLVRISVGKKMLNGIVIKKVANKPSFATKHIDAVVVTTPLPPPLIQLAEWLSQYYVTHFAIALQTILPTGLHRQRRNGYIAQTHPLRSRVNVVLNKEQQSALTIINQTKNGSILLHGVTGSGKTILYIEAAKYQAKKGKSSIILVPEIALTPQLVAEFSRHFTNLIITHSSMTESQRHNAWLKVLGHHDEPLVVIGPRSALFMPLRSLGLIVIDECQEPSYKQEQAPRYSALRTASMLARFHEGARVVLGSATPGVADFYLALHNKHPILTLKKPAQKILPVITKVVDLKRKADFRRHRIFSDNLLSQIEATLAAGRQTLLFHNRRGTAPTTLCEHCGWLAECPTCFLPLTLHADTHVLRCHICNYIQPVPPNCPVCHEPTILFKGIGTKLIETEIIKLFPKAKVARFDADTAPSMAMHHRYQEVYDGHIDILIGTQTLAKGLDLPNLCTVGVIQADSGLILPDYSADERVFQLLYQVVGRVGRNSLQGSVVIQTFQPDHPAIQAAITRDYSSFYRHELQKRRAGHFPPFTFMLKLTCSYKTEKGAINASRKMATLLRSTYPTIEVLGPTPSFYERFGGMYHWQLVLKAQNRAILAQIAADMPGGWQVDLDAYSLL